MGDEPRCWRDEQGSDSDTSRPPARLVHAARTSLLATVIYATALSERFELGCTYKPELFTGLSADLLVHLEAVSEAFQDGAKHTLWFIEPEVARAAQTVAGLARESAGASQREER